MNAAEIWQGVMGHARLASRLENAFKVGKLSGSYLLVGPRGVGKFLFAKQVAKAILCHAKKSDALESCGKCPNCLQVESGNHPDLNIVSKPDDKAFIPVQSLIGDPEHRLRAGLCYELRLKPISGAYRVAIINDADYLNAEGANALLKTLEEPPKGVVLFLVSASEQRVLPTIRSRCQAIRFGPISQREVAFLLTSKGLETDPEKASEAAAASFGSVGRATELLDPVISEFREGLYDLLSDMKSSAPEWSKHVLTFADQGSKEAAAKRARLRLAFELSADLFWQVIALRTGLDLVGDRILKSRAENAGRWFPESVERAIECLECSLECTEAVDANANATTLVEYWCDEIHRLTRTRLAARSLSELLAR